ncbi:transketolase [Aliarcobacter thereius]|uniref:Transketolase n=1 Tax=Aliarcobacter thereius LMG 24486 TaxID=1032240 RepID=A0A1C7WM81_9BACT|nr:transketolase [Aliarcobacter thereius]OCL92060.1 Transketolase [Aliarcobacter thereius]OCL94841.1 Transketolase [Aliarcobacter thereius LMG 24486]QBF15285.1 transketolase [Aliarcobacter thereius LMG 24486]TLS92023.1 transketolase [Aliarcobacter thereius]HJE03654.1 transketolase [Aliarcobacter thereius]
MSKELLQKQANTIRFLAADMVQRANSGHPGAPMGMADIATVLSNHLNLNPADEKWLNRDRLVFSGGHATGLVYSLLHLWGFDVSLNDIKNFRQANSKTPGHPEYGHTHGIEITTGPLGQGIANAVGFSAASKYAKNILGEDVINHKVYCLCGDGDLQEGISYEACSSAGHLKLDNLVIIYDSNAITIEGDTNIAWSENVKKRFQAIDFEVIEIDGHNFEQIDKALIQAKSATQPVLIIAKTTIAKGAITLEGTAASHGAPLGVEEIRQAKIKAGFDPELDFYVSAEVKGAFDKLIIGSTLQNAWNDSLNEETKKKINELQNPDFDSINYPKFEEGSSVATRDSNHKILNSIAEAIPGFLGGSADLAPSNKTELKNMGDFPNGRNIHFGIKEHAMAAIANAMNLYGLFRVYSATFFVFSDYLKPSARIAALANIPQHFIWTHDSIGVGEDGPTHQPIEHLSQFRALPNFYTFRPADANENIESWKIALKMKAPTAFVCSRQGLKVLKNEKAYGEVCNGAYLLTKRENANITIMASGSEVMLALQTACKLEEEGIIANIVSVPCFDLLMEQDKSYVEKIIDPKTKVYAVEAARALEYYKYADVVFGMETFGASGPADTLFDEFGFTVDKLKSKIVADFKNI